MVNNYSTLGLTKLIDDPYMYERLISAIRAGSKYAVPGYRYDYLLWTTRSRLEFYMCEDLDGNALGVDLNFNGFDFTTAEVDHLDSLDDGLVMMRDPENDALFPARIICPDRIPDLYRGDRLCAQAVAYPAERPETLRGDDIHTYIRDAGNGNAEICGSIENYRFHSFTFEHLTFEFWDVEADTPIGRISMLVPVSWLEDETLEQSDTEAMYIRTVCSVCLDTAIGKEDSLGMPYHEDPYSDYLPDIGDDYKYGFIPSRQNAERLLVRCVRDGSFARLPRICCHSVSVYGENGLLGEFPQDEVSALLENALGGAAESVEILHLLDCPQNSLLTGFNALVIGDGNDIRRSLTFSVNNDGFVDEIHLLDPSACRFGSDEDLHALAMFSYGMCMRKANTLYELLADRCFFRSDSVDRVLFGRDAVIARFNKVAAAQEPEHYYTYRLMPSDSIVRSGSDLPDYLREKWCAVTWQEGEQRGVVFLRRNEDGAVCHILLCEDGRYLNGFPCDTEQEKPVSSVRDLLESAYGEENTVASLRAAEISEDDVSGLWLWKQTDLCIRNLLGQLNYEIRESVIEPDCIGYACTRKGRSYAVYMFARGGQESVKPYAEYCGHLREYPLSRGRTILVCFLGAEKSTDEDGRFSCQAGHYLDPASQPEIWALDRIGGRDMLVFYPREEVFAMGSRFMAAFNSQDLDVLRALCEPCVRLENNDGGAFMNDGFYGHLSYLRKKYGKMRPAYIRYNDYAFCLIPYLENYGGLSFTVSGADRIQLLEQLDLNDGSVRDFILYGDAPVAEPLNRYPAIRNAGFLPPSDICRFSVLLEFVNGEKRRYDFQGDFGEGETARIGNIVFTDKIFRNGRITEHIAMPESFVYRDYSQRGQGIEFINGYAISTAELYWGSCPVDTPDDNGTGGI